MAGRSTRHLIIAVVILVLAGTASTSVATPAGSPDANAGAAVDPDGVDRPLDSSTHFWAGQSVAFDGSEVVTDVGNASAEDRTFELRTVTRDGATGILVREFVVATDGEVALDTAALEGRYVLRYQGQVVYVQDGVGYTAAPPDGTPVTAENSAWEVARQTLSATWSDDRVFRYQVVDLEIDSNRAAFRLEVSAAGLDYDDLVSMFDAGDFADDHDPKAGDDILILDVRPPTALPVRFAALDNGRYELVLQVADADARTSTVVQVGRVVAPTPTATPAVVVPPTTPSPTATRTSTASVASPEPTTAKATGPGPGSPGGTATGPDTASPTASPGQPGFGPALTALALAVALLALRRRERAGD